MASSSVLNGYLSAAGDGLGAGLDGVVASGSRLSSSITAGPAGDDRPKLIVNHGRAELRNDSPAPGAVLCTTTLVHRIRRYRGRPLTGPEQDQRLG